MTTNKTTCNKSRLFILWIFLFSGTVATSLAQSTYEHGAAGFSTSIPSVWEISATSNGLEISKGSSLISIENLNITSGETSNIHSLFVPNTEGATISTPYPGLRTSIQEEGYSAEVVILKTPVGFYLLSLEQDQPDSANQETFDTVLESFALLKTPPVNLAADLPNPINLGPIDLAVPDGELEVRKTSLFWKSNAAGFLTAEVVKKGTGPLLKSLEAWEKDMLNTETGLSARTSIFELTVEDRQAIQADYSGEQMQARVQVSAFDNSNALILALIARKVSFASHQPVLDAVSFSVVPADDSSVQLSTDSYVTTTPKKQTKYNEIVESISDRTLLSPDSVNHLYIQKPALFKGAEQTLKAINSFDALLASNPEALVKNVKWKGRSGTVSELEKLHVALRSYKVSIGLLPKGVKAPNLPGELSQSYASARSNNSPLKAYNDTLDSNKGFTGRNELYNELLKAKGKTTELASDELKNFLQGKADLYWRNRLEVNYQHSRLKDNRDIIIESAWKSRQTDLDAIRAAVEQSSQ